MSTPTGLKTPSASQKVLSIPELVLLTLKDLAPRDMHRAALVCRVWSEMALGYLWETAVSLAPLLNTLAPMRYSEEESNWTFVTDLGQANWPRFHMYAQRIRIVEIRYPEKRWSKPVSMDSVNIVQVSIPSGYHFPRPVRLLYDGIGPDCPENSGELAPLGLLLRNFLPAVSTSLRGLRSYDGSFINRDIDHASIRALFRSIGELETASLASLSLTHPSYFSTSPALPNLVGRHASTISSLELGVSYTEQLWTVIRSLHSLREFSIDLELACADTRSRRDTIVALDDITSTMSPKLEVFSVRFASADVNVETRRLEIFKCISRLTRLTSLTMRCRAPIMPYAHQMWHVGQSLRQLERLSIDAYTVADRRTAGTGSSLVSILQSFPHIKYFETCIICDSIPDTAQTEAHTSLETLNLSWSPVPRAEPREVAGFLKSILPRTTQGVWGEEGAFGRSEGQAAWSKIFGLMHRA